jgi:hypothetical protein
MGIAFVLLGFREFMTDIEIMLDSPMTFAFQMQMRYFVPTVIGVWMSSFKPFFLNYNAFPTFQIAYFVIAVSWFYNPPHQVGNWGKISEPTFWFGFFLGLTPILIVGTHVYWGLQTTIIHKVKACALIN